jgi:phage regulator Rha-like protein
MLDSDLARLYEVETKVLNRAVKRNINRFPDFFMFQLTDEDWKNLRCQIGTFKNDIRKYKPYAFTEHGILMLSSVLNSQKAIQVNIKIMMTFVQMRQYAVSQSETTEQIAELRKLLMFYIERTDKKIEKNDSRIADIISALNSFFTSPPTQKTIGFKTD